MPFWLLLITLSVAGAALRLDQLGAQILVNDEWHSLEFTLGHDLWHLATHFSVPGATSIPLNVYDRLLLLGWGWSELALRWPAVLPGLLIPLILPLVVRRVIGNAACVLFAALLACSPSLVFYSRLARPYAMVALLGFSALVVGERWLLSQSRRAAVAYALLAIAAIYFHMLTTPVVLAPLAWAAWAKLARRRDAVCSLPSWRRLAMVSCALALSVAPLALAARASIGPGRTGTDHFAFSSLRGVLELACGVSSPLALLLFLALAAAGGLALARCSSALAGILGAAGLMLVCTLAIVRPNGIHAPIVVLRYAIALLPAWLLLAALGLDRMTRALRALPTGRALGFAPAALFVVALLLTGPLPRTWARPNNFTNHSEFQESYAPIDWAWSHVSQIVPGFGTLVGREEIPPFYTELARAPGNAPIVEYPLMLGDHFDSLYFYQHVHRRPVIAGYAPVLPYADPGSRGFIAGDMIADEVLGRIRAGRSHRFRNMIDLTDADAVERSGASHLVLHRPHPRRPELGPTFQRLVAFYAARWKAPTEERSLVVFEVPREEPR